VGGVDLFPVNGLIGGIRIDGFGGKGAFGEFLFEQVEYPGCVCLIAQFL
jgi:hypothetical protein